MMVYVGVASGCLCRGACLCLVCELRLLVL